MNLFKNFIYLSGAEIVSKAVTFAAVAYLARVAGPEGYGYLEFAGAVLLCAGLIVDQGFDPYGAREIAKTPQATASLVSEIIIARMFLAIAAYAGIAVFAFLLHRSALVTQLLLIYGLSLLVSPFLLRWVFQGHSIMGTAASIQLVRQSIYAVVIFAFVRTGSQIWIAGMAELAGITAAVAFGVWIYRRRFKEAIRFRFKLSKQLFVEGVPIGLSQMFWMVRMFGATVIVGVLATPEDLGYFGAAMRIFIALHAFVWLYFFNLLPSLSQSWQKRDGTFSLRIAKSLHLVAWVCVFIGFIWIPAAPGLMKTIYGAAFVPSGTTLQWLCGVFIVAALSGHYRYGLIASGYQNVEMAISLLGSVVAVIMIPLGYLYAGSNGAAIGLLVGEAVVLCSAWWWTRQKLAFIGHLKLMIWPLVTAGLACIVFLLLSFVPQWIKMPIVSIFILVMAIVFDGEVRILLRGIIARIRLLARGIFDKAAQGTIH